MPTAYSTQAVVLQETFRLVRVELTLVALGDLGRAHALHVGKIIHLISKHYNRQLFFNLVKSVRSR